MKIVWTRRAVTELGLIADRVSAESPIAAIALRDRIRAAVSRLAAFPDSGRPGRVAETRELIVAGSKFIVPYRVCGGRVEILAIFHSAREWPDGF
ncbi:MAG: type II toxin-antitoxin system RelE/ParE family toxin [Bosea sp. (in: a-proteobacteria)]